MICINKNMQRNRKQCHLCERQISFSNFNSHITKCENKSKPKLKNQIKRIGTNQYTLAKRLGLPKPVVSNETRDKLRIGPSKTVWTDQMRQVMSVHAKRRGLGGKFINNKCEYNGHRFGSSYEVILAKSFDENEISWIKPKSFAYIDPFGKARTYTPDFYLPDYNIYLDPKNDFLINNVNPAMGFTDCEKIRIVEKTHNIKVIILNSKQLEWKQVKNLI